MKIISTIKNTWVAIGLFITMIGTISGAAIAWYELTAEFNHIRSETAKIEEYREEFVDIIVQLQNKQDYISEALTVTNHCLSEELDHNILWGHRVLTTNKGDIWAIVPGKYNMDVPVSLDPRNHGRELWYQPIGSTTKIKYERR